MSVQMPARAEATGTHVQARRMIARPDLHHRKDLTGACEFLLMRGDHIDVVRAQALLKRLEAEADEDRALPEILRDVPLSDWIGGAAIFVGLLGAYFLINLAERFLWIGAMQ